MHSPMVGSLPGSIPGGGLPGQVPGRYIFSLYAYPSAVDKAAGGIASMGALTLSKTHAAKAG